MKSIAKLAVAAFAVVVLAGCTGTTYNADKSCSTDFILIPAISISGAIGGCGK